MNSSRAAEGGVCGLFLEQNLSPLMEIFVQLRKGCFQGFGSLCAMGRLVRRVIDSFIETAPHRRRELLNSTFHA